EHSTSMWPLLIVGLVIALIATGCSRTIGSVAARPPHPEVLGLVRTVVVDSVKGGGTQPGQLLFAQDSGSRRLLESAGVVLDAAAPSGGIVCPGSTTSAGAKVPPPFGY